MDRLEKHYFRLMRSTLFLERHISTYLTVLNTAREQGVVKVYPIECYVQRQQLKFLWKIMHLGDLALQRIVLHSKLDPQYSNGRGGQQRTYKQCIKDAPRNFGVTMDQCMAMERQDWDLNIEGIGLETAVRQWEARPKASLPIDREWRNMVGNKQGRPPAPTPAEPSDGTDDTGVESGESMEEESTAQSVTEDEFAQFPDTAEEKDGRADEEDATPWDRYAREAGHDEEETKIRHWGVLRCRNNHTNTERQLRAGGANQDTQRSQEQSPHTGVETETKAEKRKAMTAIRHRRRNRKLRAEEISLVGHDQRHRDLQVIVGAGISPQEHRSMMVPWEHRGILGHTRGREGQKAAAAGGGQDGACRR